MRATIHDIASRAGVSAATVDRVLNGRKGVSAANRQRVMRAAQELRYLPTDGQAALPVRPAQLEFLIPRARQVFLSDLAEQIEEFAATLPVVSRAKVHAVEDLSPEAFVSALGRIDTGTQGVGIVAVDHPLTRQAVRDLTDGGVKVVTIASDLLTTPRSAYVGLDDRVAGRTAGLVMGHVAGRSGGKVALFVGQQAFQGQREREIGFRTIIEQEFPTLELLPLFDTRSDTGIARSATERLLAAEPDLAGIYVMGGGRSGVAEATARVDRRKRPFVILHDLSDTTRRYLSEGSIDLIIDQNVRLLAEQAVIRLLTAIAAERLFLPEHFIEPRLIFRENIPM
ncbi:LacI family DNA-binding transcriptional regulator [Histidinibacterium lentulum]|uniref:LacI family DNA-binding transcriptional regulator n=1 Tax=Histidinibacterium lentulum TaxID=2480588 RepID=A0A3N2QTI7_9RHOB|nr:LacI family DNA-binding transcriptional regulator [Histidinibacterium lentulum]ROT98518.1 LacI family DNA-binding transcriptional regulator [Histidinibacterium lentulum]